MELFPNSENSWRIVETPSRGRGLVATRNFQPGDVIYKDFPVILGPRVKELCVGCHGLGPLSDCPHGCHLPVCSAQCADSPLHVAECSLLRKALPEHPGPTWKNEITCCIVVLRCLFLKPEDKEFLLCLQGHEGKIHGFEAKVLKKYLGAALSPEDEKWLHKCCEILDTNAFDVSDGKENKLGYCEKKIHLRGVYRLAGFMNHDCSPNTCLSFDKDSVMYVSAAKPIRAGEEITTIYCTLLWSTPTRRGYIYETKHFLCECDRCTDPTEFGANLSAVACPMGTGYMLPSTPLNPHSSWSCNCCTQVLSYRQIAFLQMAQSVVISRMNISHPTSVYTFLKENELPSSSQVSLVLKLEAAQRLGHIKGYTWKELTEDSLALKEDLCRDILETMDYLQIGYCRSKGLVLLELHCVLCEKLKKLESNGNQQAILTDLRNTLAEAQAIFNIKETAPKLLDQQIDNQNLIESLTEKDSNI